VKGLTFEGNGIIVENFDGVGLLVEQAAEGFEWWRRARPKVNEVTKKLTVALTCWLRSSTRQES
jgi:shikimate 5-dehydrogenase